jgi:uncharacterized protein DUF4190
MNQPDPQRGKKDGPPPDQAHDPTTDKVHGPTLSYDPQAGQPFGPYPGQSLDPLSGRPHDPRSGPAYQPPAALGYDLPWGTPHYGPPYQGPYPPAYGPYPLHRPTNGLAIASLVLGILWIYWIGSILALVFGYVARRQIAERGESGSGLAVVGIVLGWNGVGLLAFMFFILFLGALTSPL